MKTKKFTQKMKFYHIVLISIILCPFLILNSNSVNKKREETKSEKEKNIFMRKLYARKLDADTFVEDTNKVCEKASKEVRDYYSGKGDLNSIGVDNNNVERKDKNKYIDGLINTVSGEGEGDLMDYVMHLIPILALIGISILFLPGWLLCCICSCSDCCCCCCCIKANCKLPFYIITSFFYAFGLGVSIYGLSQSKAVFEGLGDTECSLLQFINEVLNGESNLKEPPRWAGIAGIQNLLRDTATNVNSLGDTSTLSTGRTNTAQKLSAFEYDLDSFSKSIRDNKDDYKKELHFSENSKDGNYYLDIIPEFGVFDKGSGSITPNSFVFKWYNEYKLFATQSDSQMDSAITNFNDLISANGATNQIANTLNEGANKIDDIKSSFDKVKKKISVPIVDYSDMIDEYGNMGYKIVFSIFLVIDSLIASFISLRMFCKFPALNCLLKCATHTLWNVLALMTFLTLLLGSILSLVGTAGGDLVSVVSFLVSDDNLLNENGTPNNEAILLGDSSKYLTHCINLNGDLSSELSFTGAGFNNLEALKQAETRINNLIETFDEIGNRKEAYKNYKIKHDKRKSFETDDFELIVVDSDNNKVKSLKLKDYIEKVNSFVASEHDKWSISCSGSNTVNCDTARTSGDTQNYCISLSTCQSTNFLDYYSGKSTITSNENVITLNSFIESINTLNHKDTNIPDGYDGSTPISTKNIENILYILNLKYGQYLASQTENLGLFQSKISGLTNIINRFTGQNGNFFDIINCKFIGNNIRIILKSLDKSLGTNIYNIGLTMVATGLAMCLSISFTIVLNVILNTKDNGNPIKDLNAMNKNVNIENQFGNMNQGPINSENAFPPENAGLKVVNYNGPN